MICSRLYGAIRQCDQIEPCCKASWEWVWWSWRRWGCPFSVCSKHWYPDLHRVLEWLMAWPLFLWSYRIFTGRFWGASSLPESPVGIWAGWGKWSLMCCCAQSSGSSLLKSRASADFLFPPQSIGGTGLKTRRWVAWGDSCSKPKAFDFGKLTSVLALPL